MGTRSSCAFGYERSLPLRAGSDKGEEKGLIRGSKLLKSDTFSRAELYLNVNRTLFRVTWLRE